MASIADQAHHQKLKQAMELESAGDPSGAAIMIEKLLEEAPNMPEARFQFARLLLRSKAPAMAVPHLKVARKLAPSVLAVWKLSAQAVLGFGKDQDVEDYKKDLRKAPLTVQQKKALFTAITHVNHGSFGGASKAEADALIATIAKGEFQEALKLGTELNARFPDTAHILNVLATAHEGLGDVDTANLHYNRAILLDPRSPSILLNFSRFLNQNTRRNEATHYVEKAHQLKPDDPHIQGSLAHLLVQNQNSKRALELVNKSMAAGNQSLQNVITKAQATVDMVSYQDGVAILNTHYEKNKNEAIKMPRARIHQHAGQFDLALQDYLDVIKAAPLAGDTYFQVSMVHKFQNDDPLLALFEDAAKNPEMTDDAKIDVNFGLAKAYEDTKQPEKVFAPLNLANKFFHEKYPFDRSTATDLYGRVTDLAQSNDLDQIRDNSKNTYDPIFVSGLPRSGTTLTEQILNAHSTLTGVGEAFWSDQAFNPVFTEVRDGGSIEEALVAAGQVYQSAALVTNSPDRRIVDKALNNHQRVGLISAAMPNSKIIILKRDPRDNLLSIYKNRFAPGALSYNSDLRDLAFAYAQFLKYLEFWEKLMPGSFYTLEYDKLTSDPESEIRNILAYCGLDWEDSIMDYGAADNSIRTLSSYQARQPIYRSSVRSWEKYADELKPMIDALKEFGVPLDD